MLFEGILVDLVSYDQSFRDRDHEWGNGPMVFYWSMGGHWFNSRAQIAEMHRWHREERPEGDLRVRFGVRTKDGTPIGMFGINRLFPHDRVAMLTATIGDPDYWGGGYGTDALLLLIDYAFDWLDLRRLWLMTMALNARVLRQMEKVGFMPEARHREATWANNGWVDALQFGMLREEWPGRAVLVDKLKLAERAATHSPRG